MRASRLAISLAGAALAALAVSLIIHHDDVMVRTIAVGQNPALFAIDNLTGRAFVLDAGTLARNAGGGIVEGTIHTLDIRTGTLLRTVPAGTEPDDVAVDEQTGRVFVLNSYAHNGGQGTVTVLNAQSGKIVRTTQVGDLPTALALDVSAGRVFVLNAPR